MIWLSALLGSVLGASLALFLFSVEVIISPVTGCPHSGLGVTC